MKWWIENQLGEVTEITENQGKQLLNNKLLFDALEYLYAFVTKGYDQDVPPYNNECPVCHSERPYHNGLCPKAQVDKALAQAKGQND